MNQAFAQIVSADTATERSITLTANIPPEPTPRAGRPPDIVSF
jgi:hypothetical protein